MPRKRRTPRNQVPPSKRNRAANSGQARRDRRLRSRFGEDSLIYLGPMSMHKPLPNILITRFTASGSCYTATGSGTGDYNWALPLNWMYQPFSMMTTGVTWNHLTPSTYNPTGYSSIFPASEQLYGSWIVYDTLFELDVLPQSVTDSVVVTLTASDSAGVPANVGAASPLPFTKTYFAASNRTIAPGEYPIKFRFEPHKLQGIKRELYDNDQSGNYVGAPTGNPPAQWFIVMNVETGDNSTLTTPLLIRIRQTFWVRCFGLETAIMAETLSALSRQESKTEESLSVALSAMMRESEPRGCRTVRSARQKMG